MKRLLVCSLVLLLLLSFSYANATLLGVNLSGQSPDITIDSSAYVTFDSFGPNAGGHLEYYATDLIITYADGDFQIAGFAGMVSFFMDWDVNSSGGLIANSGTMTEEVIEEFTLDRNNKTYNVGDILLTGDVVGFGWDNGGSSGKARWDFLIDLDNASSLLVVDGIWSPSPPATGIVGGSDGLLPPLVPGDVESWPVNWASADNDFKIEKAKSDKAPTPEPGTLLLMGSGLVGFAGYARLRYRRKKK